MLSLLRLPLSPLDPRLFLALVHGHSLFGPVFASAANSFK